MPKRDIHMSDDEIDTFLPTQTTVMVLANGPTPAPEGSAGRLTYADGRVAFALHHDDPIVPLLERDPRACCVVEQFPSYYEIVGVMIHGRVTRRDMADDGEAAFDLDVDKTVSFDFGKLQA